MNPSPSEVLSLHLAHMLYSTGMEEARVKRVVAATMAFLEANLAPSVAGGQPATAHDYATMDLSLWEALPSGQLVTQARDLAEALRSTSAAGEYVDLSPAARACILALCDRIER